MTKLSSLAKTSYKKPALFTDIHFGRKQNSEQHNQDCINYIDWFCAQVKADPEIDCVIFLGDWHEHRSAINGMTLHFSHLGAKKLNDLGLPIFFIVGNHDLYFRNNRDIFTTVVFQNLENFVIVDQPLRVGKSTAIVPFLFEEEYPEFFSEHSDCDVFFGHFEFKGFVLTGETHVKEHGPDPDDYAKPKKIFSGHYHKRQSKGNIHYIGNAFPADFSDANDTKRGMATYDYKTDKVEYVDWPECPKYISTKLSDLLNDPKQILKNGARVRVTVDEDISLEENIAIKQSLAEQFGLRELVLDEKLNLNPELTEIEKEVEELELTTTNDIIVELLRRVKIETIDSEELIRIYRSL